MFRSKDITGPYVDEAGNTAISTKAIGNNWQSDIGERLMSSIQWSGKRQREHRGLPGPQFRVR